VIQLNNRYDEMLLSPHNPQKNKRKEIDDVDVDVDAAP
jgi:hypothetical protein